MTMSNTSAPSPLSRNLIAVMGATGVGKSSFINLAAGREIVRVGEDLESCTSEIGEVSFRINNHHVKLVDTPGFDDTNLTDTEVLRMIATWMQVAYSQGAKFNGIIYMREITETRMKNTAVKNLSMFRKLCGTSTLASVLLVTTKWDGVTVETGRNRENALREKYWKSMLDSGANMARHNNTSISAQHIVAKLLGKPEIVLEIQHELVDEDRQLEETAAGSAVNEEVSRVRTELDAKMARNLRELREEKDEDKRKDCQRHQAELEAAARAAENEQKALKESRTKEIEELQRKLREQAAASGKTTGDIVLEGVFGIANRVVEATPAAMAHAQSAKPQTTYSFSVFNSLF